MIEIENTIKPMVHSNLFTYPLSNYSGLTNIVKGTQVCHSRFEEPKELLKYLLFYSELYGVYNRCVTLCYYLILITLCEITPSISIK